MVILFTQCSSRSIFFTLFTILGTSIRCRLQLLWFNSIINLHRERNIEYRSMVIVYQITSQELSQTSIFCSAFVGSGGGARVLECPSLDEVNPNFSRCSKWLPFLCTSSAQQSFIYAQQSFIYVFTSTVNYQFDVWQSKDVMPTGR